MIAMQHITLEIVVILHILWTVKVTVDLAVSHQCIAAYYAVPSLLTRLCWRHCFPGGLHFMAVPHAP